MSPLIILVGSLQSQESSCEGGRRSEVRQDSVPMTLKMGEVESPNAAGLWNLEKGAWALQEESCLDHSKTLQGCDNEHVLFSRCL